MEDLIAQFTLLSNQALLDKNFDPSNIEDLMKLFEIEAYNSWAAMELECNKEEQDALNTMDDAEQKLNSAMENAMEEFQRFDDEFEKEAMDELQSLEKEAIKEYISLLSAGESARKLGNSVVKAANVASKKYVEAALNSATNSMKSAWKGISTNKVHPS